MNEGLAERVLKPHMEEQGELPILRETVVDLLNAVESEKTSASDVARIILRDQGCTTNLLKAANSVYYNPMDAEITTISKAVVILGNEMIRNISLGLAFVEMFQKHHPDVDLKKIVANAFIAATVAREAAMKVKNCNPEEAFINALMYNIGPVSIAYYMPDKYMEVQRLSNQLKIDPIKAQEQTLGFTFSDIGAALAKEWKLPSSIAKTIEMGDHLDSMDISTSEQQMWAIAKTSNEITWNLSEETGTSGELQKLLGRLERGLKMNSDECQTLVERSYEEVTKIIGPFDMQEDKFIPATPELKGAPENVRDKMLVKIIRNFEQSKGKEEADEEERERLEKEKATASLMQLNFLREISSLLFESDDISVLFDMILEGIHRGVGFDRVMLALCSSDKKNIVGRYSIGVNAKSLFKDFNIENDSNDNIFGHVFLSRKPAFVSNIAGEKFKHLIPPYLVDILNSKSFVLAPINSSGTIIGFFYADNAPSGKKITEDAFQAFLHFALQANIGLERHALKSK